MAITTNQTVSMEYEVSTEGTVIDSNVGQEPLKFTFGNGEIIAGLEARISHLSTGDSHEVIVPAAEAYGEYEEDATQAVPKEHLDGVEDIQPGMPLQGQGPDGNTIQVTIKEVLENDVIIDFNHPLAGKDLAFKVTILNVQ
jgi:FKBP-type peptidyl-prolyl cis-trans isomerase SlyD